MFKKVEEVDVKTTLNVISKFIYPLSINRKFLSHCIFESDSDIADRKVRLCIAELRKRGYFIIAKNGYSRAGNEAEPAIRFIQQLYSRAAKLRAEADILYGLAKAKYGDKALQIEQNPQQPGLDIGMTVR